MVVLATAAAGTTVAEAKPGASTIVLEAHVGQRTPEVAAAMAPVLDELERHGFAVSPEVIRQLLGGRAPRPGRLDEGKTIADIKQLVSAGRSAFDKGMLEASEKALRGAVELIRRNPTLLVLDTNNERVTYNAFASLSMTLYKRGNIDESNKVMLDLLRVSSRPIPQDDFGPKAIDLHAEAEKRAQAMGRGSLAISVSDSRAMVFVDYTYRGMGQVALGDQLPGRHSVLVQVPGTVGLQYVRDVQAGTANALDVNWEAEFMLHLEGLWAGFLLATEDERARESLLVTELARHLGVDDVIILSAQKVGGVEFIGGIQYPANGEPPIGAFAPINGGEPLLRALGTYLYNGTMAAGLRVLRAPAKGEPSTVADRDSGIPSSWMPTWVPAAVTGAGAAVMLGGAVAYIGKPYDPSKPRADATDGRYTIVDIMVGGSAVLGAGVYLWSRESLSARPLAAGALGLGIASTAVGVQLYLVNQDGSAAGPRYIRQTKTAGVIVGAAGLALSGAGIWLLHRDRASAVSSDVAVRHRPVPTELGCPSYPPTPHRLSSDALEHFRPGGGWAIYGARSAPESALPGLSFASSVQDE
jgi:hypothetical protein